MRDLARFPDQDPEIRECLHRLAQWCEEVAGGIESSLESEKLVAYGKQAVAPRAR